MLRPTRVSLPQWPSATTCASALRIDRRYFAWLARFLVWLVREPDGGEEPAELRPGFLGVSIGQVGITIEVRGVEADLRVLAQRAKLAGLCSPDRCEVRPRECHRGATCTERARPFCGSIVRQRHVPDLAEA